MTPQALLRFMDQNAQDNLNLTALEDPEVLALCERLGFGAVISSASRQWCRRDPVGGFIYTAWGLVTSALGPRQPAKKRHESTCECANIRQGRQEHEDPDGRDHHPEDRAQEVPPLRQHLGTILLAR